MTTTPRVYAACLASYNAAVLHGVWIDADHRDLRGKQMTEKRITLKYEDGRTETVFVHYDNPKNFLDRIEAPKCELIIIEDIIKLVGNTLYISPTASAHGQPSTIIDERDPQ